MELIESHDDIYRNILAFDSYIISIDKNEQLFAFDRIKYGTCFVVYKKENNYCFAPSRFIGYKNNNLIKHDNNNEKDGKETNPAISRILNIKLIYTIDLEQLYIDFCNRLGIKSNKSGSFGAQRKYWNSDINLK